MRGRSFLALLIFSACGAPAQPDALLPTAATSTDSSTTTTLAPTPTTTTTIAPTTTVAERGSLVIHGVGDVNLDPSSIPALVERGFDWAWTGLDGLFLEDDLTVVNLECSPSSLGTPEPKAFTFQCPEGLAEMEAAGVEVANLGNNHSQDFGTEAMLDGRQRLRGVGITPVGAGSNAAQAASFAPFRINGWKVAVVGFGGVRPHDGWIATDDRAGMADGDTIESMVAAVGAAESWADWVVVSIHWGVELDRQPRPDDIERAEAMVAAGADMVFGHHPHRLQTMEILNARPVAWSLGNFVWPNVSAAGSETAVARVEVTPEGEITGCLIPVSIESSGHPVLTGEPSCEATS